MNDTTTNTAEQIRETFKHWGTVPALCEHNNVASLRSAYEYQSGPTHWFDADTLRFFGSRNLHVPTPGFTVETQTNAPEGVGRYKVTAWVYDFTAESRLGNLGRLTPQGLASFYTLAEARNFAAAAGVAWGAARS